MSNPRYVPQKAKVDDVVNVPRTAAVVVAPFHQYAWDDAASARLRAQVDLILRASPLLTPNPTRPFKWDNWELPARAKPPQKSDAPTDERVIRSPNPTRPFKLDDWDLPAQGRPPQKSDTYRASNAIIAPNPAKPFHQDEWPRLQLNKSAKVDTINLLLPIYSGKPFVNSTDNRSFAQQSVKSDIVVNFLPLRAVAVVAPPFSMSDWPNATRQALGQDTSEVIPWSPFFPPSPPPPPPPPPEPPPGHGGGFGGGYEWEKRRRRYDECRKKRFDDENEERRALGAMLRDIMCPPEPVPEIVTAEEVTKREVVVNPEIARLLTKSDKAKSIIQYRKIVDEITAKVLAEYKRRADEADEDDVEVVLMSM